MSEIYRRWVMFWGNCTCRLQAGRRGMWLACIKRLVGFGNSKGLAVSLKLGFLTNWSSEMCLVFSTHPTEIWCIAAPFGVTSRGWRLLLLLLCPQWLPLSHVLLPAHKLCPGFLKVEDSSGDGVAAAGVAVCCLDECIAMNLIIAGVLLLSQYQ